MPFNSSQNNFTSKYEPEKSFHELQNSYTLSKEGFDHIPYPDMIYRPTSTVEQYILPANVHSSVGYYDQDELNYINHESRKSQPRKQIKNDYDSDLEGGGIGKMYKSVRKKTKNTVNKSVDVVKKGATVSEKATRGTRKAVVKSTVNKNGVIHQAIGKTLDIGIPMASAAVGAAIGAELGNPAAGAFIGKQVGSIGRKQLNQKTGYGAPGVGEYKENVKLDKILSKYAPNYKNKVLPDEQRRYIKPVKQKKPASERNLIVKQIMKEKGLSLPEASKHVKQNNLY